MSVEPMPGMLRKSRTCRASPLGHLRECGDAGIDDVAVGFVASRLCALVLLGDQLAGFFYPRRSKRSMPHPLSPELDPCCRRHLRFKAALYAQSASTVSFCSCIRAGGTKKFEVASVFFSGLPFAGTQLRRSCGPDQIQQKGQAQLTRP